MNPIVSLHAFVLGTENSLPSESRAAIEFKLAPNWHIYWENYGDTGMSTTADDATLLYPTPQKIPLPGELLSYGYTGRVVFFVRNPKNSIFLRWLACKEDTCIPGKKKIRFEPAKSERFQSDWEALPKDCPFSWEHQSDGLSKVDARLNSWMAPYTDLANDVHSQYQQNGSHFVRWKNTKPFGRFLWTNDTLSCIIHI